MAEIFILSPEDELLAVLSSDGQDSCNFWDAKYKEELNLGSSFSFIADASHSDAKYLFEENQVVFRDKDGELRAFVIKELDDTDDGAELSTLVTCEAAMMELAETIIKEKRPKDKTAQYVLDQVFERTRWTVEVTVELGLNSTSFYKMNVLECLSDVLNKWGGEFKDVVEFDGNTITKRTIKVLSRRGKDSGKRFEIDKDTESIRRTVISYPKTALYGYGASLQTTDEDGEETGGYSRFIDFAEVEWKKSNGDPVDKPKGQEWVGDPALLQKYGRLKNGALIHREDIFTDENIEDPEELLKATYNHLMTVASKTEINYELSVKLLEGMEGYEHEQVELGDRTIAIDRNFANPVEITQRIISMEYDISDPINTCVVELGQFLSVYDDDINRKLKDLEESISKPRPTNPIDNNSYPDIKPGTPKNVEANGSFKTIQIFWEYDSNIYINHYEVYGSQINEFVPSNEHLLWRGKTSAFVHEVETDEVWYYRVRAVNTRNTPGDFSLQVSASTVRVISDDILFGSVIANHLADNLDLAEKLSQNTVKKINEVPMKEIQEAQSAIDVLSEQINLKVSKDGLISEINLSPEGILISGDRIHISGQTLIDDAVIGVAAIANAAITSAKIANLAVGNSQIQDLAVTNAKIANLAVDDAKIADLSVSKLKAGTIDTSTIKIRGGSAIDYTLIDGSYLESRGRFTRTWQNKTETHDVTMRFQNGYFRASNLNADRNLYYSDFGISTYASGNQDESSGTVEFFSYDYHPVRKGITISSVGGVVALRSSLEKVILDAYDHAYIKSNQQQVRIQPRNHVTGNNTFAFHVVDNNDASLQDGVLFFGSENNSKWSSGLRFSKTLNSNTLYVTDGDGVRGAGNLEVFNLRVNNRMIGGIEATNDNAFAYVNNAFKIMNKDGSALRDLESRNAIMNDVIFGSLRTADTETNTYIGVGSHELRITNNQFFNSGNTVYRAIRAAAFNQGSSRQYKTNINPLTDVGLEVIRELRIVEYDLKDDIERNIFDNTQVGLIAEDSPKVSTSDNLAINMYKLSSYNTKAIQELDIKMTSAAEEIEWLKIENQYLRQKIKQLEEKTA
ncbi:phage tail spike protein [Bacillus safensis]|uniref:phage tail spike protein n=1 Tax=Bacillus safensis TaxID=561879 RepID=UPI0032522E03